MLLRVLAIANLALAVAVGWLLYTVTTWGEGINCDRARSLGDLCSEPMDPATLLLVSVMPVATAAALVFIAFRLRSKNTKAAALLLMLFPFAVGIESLRVLAP